jgi:pimeloyl-ACP methyl ester carboxylesterase
VLVIQGNEDEYGTLRQLDLIEAGCRGPVERVVLAGGGHSPHRDEPERTLAAMADFVSRAFGRAQPPPATSS